VLFIAPLLFEDAKKADKPALWRLKRPVLSLAIGLVVATCLILGFSVHLLVPSIPLAAAFAMAAALAPTDAVAVSSLKETSTISGEQNFLLKGESLLNDAASIVSFQFAIAALLTSSFSLFAATGTFFIMFFGGLVLGVALMLLRYVSLRALRASGIELTTFMVLFEVITPFLVFLIAEMLHVSGIIAVVAAGITYSFSPRPSTPTNARYQIVSTSVWAVGTFALNGLVFLMLGTQLPFVVRRVWSSSPAADNLLVLIIVFILVVILLIRFLWVLAMHRNVNIRAGGVAMMARVQPAGNLVIEEAPETELAFDKALLSPSETSLGEVAEMNEEDPEFTVTGLRRESRRDKDRREKRARLAQIKTARRQALTAEKHAAHADPDYWGLHLRDALLLSLCGAKGAITLAVVLTIPLTLHDGSPFPERDLIIFLASGVIVLSLLLANFIIPFVAPKVDKELVPEGELNAMYQALRSVIHKLLEHSTPADKAATDEVIRHYNARLRTLKANNRLIAPEEERLRALIIGFERDHTLELIDEGRVSLFVGLLYINQHSHMLARLEHRNTVRWELNAIIEQLKHLRAFRKRLREMRKLGAGGASEQIDRENAKLELRVLQKENTRYSLVRLEELKNDPECPLATQKAVRYLTAELQRRADFPEDRGSAQRAMDARRRPEYEMQVLVLEHRALEYEREAIGEALEKGAITKQTAKEMRDNVAMMELDIEEQLE